MLSWHSLELVSCRKLQTLWAGYGYIYELKARATNDETAAELRKKYSNNAPNTKNGEELFPLILKYIAPPPTSPGSEDEGHLRKVLSYGVEQYFYSSVAPLLEDDTAVSYCIATTLGSHGKPGAEDLQGLTATIMTDLKPSFPVAGEKRSELNENQIYAALDWLSSFHRTSRRFMSLNLQEYVRPPLEEAERRRNGDNSGKTLWLNGGYTYLATRRKEYKELCQDEDSEWSVLCKPFAPGGQAVSEMVADFLTPHGRDYETLIHGDVKSENLFTMGTGKKAAFYDFQYVGLGLGVCDLAKLFTCSVPRGFLIEKGRELPWALPMTVGESKLLEYYYSKLTNDFRDAEGRKLEYDWDSFIRHWDTALVDWLRFQASWGFWGNTDWLEARVRYIITNEVWREWLQKKLKSGSD
ncbi:Ecdysteroid kinase-domain-containing protein [Daldinia bambusicola]|nr:Ecdysteroid kinase-domain-containing protein [Daldinia bambusicola]